ncbi:MAG: SAM-dependent DNA methyltransferase [Candidatus Hydrothermae bacterium]|nr:SAM-dependent DNA methyltransferase [Candidatus Hydrothermae bacterium]
MNEISKHVTEYLNRTMKLPGESARSQSFTILLGQLFGDRPDFIENYVKGIEQYVRVKKKDIISKGWIDTLFGNLIIEFEADLTRESKLREAEEQLRRYVAFIWSIEKPGHRAAYICMATDGLNFKVYSPKVIDPEKESIYSNDVELVLIDEKDLRKLRPIDVYFWLDRYFSRKERLVPTTEYIVADFGLNSHAFITIHNKLMSLWKDLKDVSEYHVIYENWAKYLRIVYGSAVEEDELFCRHTYLSILAKLMAWARLQAPSLREADLLSVLSGEFFDRYGIKNFLEEDFFSWIAREEVGAVTEGIAKKMLSLLQNYDLTRLTEDVLKSLYQELVDPQTRHDLGEFYTPDWLAHRIVKRLIAQKPDGTFLDPACGSGTFLYFTILEKRAKFPSTPETLEHILQSVIGIDIHPLAVTIAKTNYVLALGDLLREKTRPIHIPVYLADSINVPEEWIRNQHYQPVVREIPIYLPKKLVDDPLLFDEGIEAAKKFAKENAGQSPSRESFIKFLQIHHTNLLIHDSIVNALYELSLRFKEYIETKQDTIWAFVLKNRYKPVLLKGKFDFVLGNPPWLALRYADPSYQQIMKNKILGVYHLLDRNPNLITHLELGTLFLVASADIYLKTGGTIAFVLPRSIFSADQHEGLRSLTFSRVFLKFTEIWDLENVEPLFGVPACVLFAEKLNGVQDSYPVRGEILHGNLVKKNQSYRDAQQLIRVESVHFFLNRTGTRTFWGPFARNIDTTGSYYYDYVKEGASLVPRCFWFVEIKESPLGIDPNAPFVRTSRTVYPTCKHPYKLELEGQIESDFLYATVLSKHLVPFGILDFSLIVLPIEPQDNTYRIIDAEEAKRRGYIHLSNWLEQVEREWFDRKRDNKEDFTSLARLNYNRELTSQDPSIRYLMVYNGSGTYLTSAVIQNHALHLNSGGFIVQAKRLVVDSKLYYYGTNNLNEVLYLSSVLNAPVVDKLIKPMQSRGQFGARDIGKKPFELPIPRFDPKNSIHQALVVLARACTNKIQEAIRSGTLNNSGTIGTKRQIARRLLAHELAEIDKLVKQILQL